MKRILVPTDFSDAANNALDYAISIANKSMGEITLFHVTSTHRSEEAEEYEELQAEQQLEILVDRCFPRLWDESMLTGSTMSGDPVKLITERADRQQYDLIVMGTEGTGGIKDFLVGSTTLEIIRRVLTPVIAVPKAAVNRGIKDIVLAIDDKGLKDKNALAPLRQIAHAFDANIRIYHQAKNKQSYVPDLLVDAVFEGIEHSFHNEISEEEVASGILRYASQQNADLLCLIRKERGLWERLFHNSITKEELSTSEIPLFILQEKN